MEIIQHGDTVNQIKCERCGCVFTYNQTDIEKNNLHYYFAYTTNKDYQFFVSCPECRKMLPIEEGVG